MDRGLPFFDTISYLRQPSDIRTNFGVYMLLGLAIASIKQGRRRRNPGRIRSLWIVHDRDKRLDGSWHVFSRQLFDLGYLLGSSPGIPALAFLKWFSNSHAVSLLF